MQKLKTFYYTYIKSMTSISYYKDVIAAKTGFTIKYFLILSLIFSAILTVKTTIKDVPFVKKAVAEFGVAAKQVYEPDLIVKVAENNAWSINKLEPYKVPVPAMKKGDTEKFPANLIVLDHNGTIDDLTKLDTFVLINTKNIIIRDNRGFKVYPLENLPVGELTQADFNNFIDQLMGITKWLPLGLVLFAFLGPILYFVLIQGSNFFLFGFFVWIAAKIAEFELSYKNATKITAHAATLPLTLYVATNVLGINIPVLFWVEILNIILAIGVVVSLSKAKKAKSELPIDGTNSI